MNAVIYLVGILVLNCAFWVQVIAINNCSSYVGKGPWVNGRATLGLQKKILCSLRHLHQLKALRETVM